MSRPLYIYEVNHPEHESVQVPSPDRLRAITGAAKVWGVNWTDVARQCDVRMLGPAPDGPKPVERKSEAPERRGGRKKKQGG